MQYLVIYIIMILLSLSILSPAATAEKEQQVYKKLSQKEVVTLMIKMNKRCVQLIRLHDGDEAALFNIHKECRIRGI